MKRTSAELKRISRERLKGHYGIPMGAIIVADLIILFVTLPFSYTLDISNSLLHMAIYQLVILIAGLINAVISGGLTRIHLRLSRFELPEFTDLFYGFKARPDRFLLAYFLLFIISVICVVPGSIVIFSAGFSGSVLLWFTGGLLLCGAIAIIIWIELKFALVFILLADHPSMNVPESFRESSRLMGGNKGRLFYIQLSFIGWSLLGILSCFIGFLWLQPYIEQTYVCFYRDVTGETDIKNDD